MMMSDRYMNFLSSVQKFCKDCCGDLQLASISENAKVIDFDAFAETETFPDEDLVGPAEFSLEGSGGHYIITVMIGVSTKNDEGLYRLNQMVNFIHTKLDTTSLRVPVVHYQTGANVGLLTVMDGLTVLPVTPARNRPLKFIAVQFGTDLATP